LLDFCSCRNTKCKIIIPIIRKGKTKWREKNRFKVEFLTENPPHTHSTKLVPRYGIAESKFVITVAPQYDI
jgi:hypothetical protein